MKEIFWIAPAVAFAFSMLAVMVLRPVLRRYGVVDSPSARSSHTRVTLRGGGIAPLIGIVCGTTVVVLLGAPPSVPVLLSVVAGSVFAAAVGLIEDVRGLRIPVRAASQLAAGAAIAIPLAVLFERPWYLAAAAAIAIMLFINIANFMDGINGISGVHAALIGGTYAVVGTLAELPWATVLGLMIAASFLGFLPWNLARPGLFLGDVGSYLLGAITAGLGIALLWAGVDPIAAVAPLVIYLVDTLLTLGRRAARGEAILQSHRTHAYQRLTDTGLTHLAATTIVATFTLVSGAIGVLREAQLLSAPLAWLLLTIAAALYLVLPRLRGSRLPAPLSMDIAAIPDPGPTPARPHHAPTVWVVVGATGFVGSALVERLRAEAVEVRTVRAPRLLLPGSVSTPDEIAAQAQSSDALDPVKRHLVGADVVINAAGLATPGAPPSPELYGANALLPALLLRAADEASVSRVIHLSSAAVQGHRPVLDETLDAQPFSPYSRSKALGERAFFRVRTDEDTDAVVIRATSVQGAGRPTTESLKRISRSALASVAGDGTQPTVVSSIDGLVDFVVDVGRSTDPIGPIMLQPWEGLSTADVLRAARGSDPRRLPRWLCMLALRSARVVGRVVPEVAGIERRVALMWFGQAQHSAYESEYPATGDRLRRLLAERGGAR